MPIQTTYTSARAHLAKLFDEVTANREIVIINRRGAEDVALIAAEELSSLMETAHLLRSPRNLKRLRHFAAKCVTYLSRGIGLVVLDVVTTRQANLHNDMVELLGMDSSLAMPQSPAIYSVAYRPLQESGVGRIETWLFPLCVGEPLPAVPLSLAADLCVQVDLEGAYAQACQRRRFDEVAG